MKKVRNITGYMGRLTRGKIYDVIEENNEEDSILIVNDLGFTMWYSRNSTSKNETLFLDVTAKLRNKTITEILS